MLLSFVVGASQAAEWLDEIVPGMQAGNTTSVKLRFPNAASDAISHRVFLVRVVPAAADVSPAPLPGVSAATLARIDDADKRRAAAKARAAARDAGDLTPTGPEPAAASPALEAPAVWSDVEFRDRADKARDAGNEIVTSTGDVAGKGRKQLRVALARYHEALELNSRAGGQRNAAFAAKVLGNIALVLAKCDDWKAVLLYCGAVLELDPNNAKAHFRRGQTCKMLRLFMVAERALARALQLKPNDAATVQELRESRRVTVDLLRKTRADFADVYNKLCSSPIYDAVKEDDARGRDTGRLSGFAAGFMQA